MRWHRDIQRVEDVNWQTAAQDWAHWKRFARTFLNLQEATLEKLNCIRPFVSLNYINISLHKLDVVEKTNHILKAIYWFLLYS